MDVWLYFSACISFIYLFIIIFLFIFFFLKGRGGFGEKICFFLFFFFGGGGGGGGETGYHIKRIILN